jgi:hypothetical protein
MLPIVVAKPQEMQVFDLPIAIMFVALGIGFLAIRKQQSAARGACVERGELTAEEAKKKDRTLSVGAYAITAIGALLLLAHFAGI